MVTLAHPPEQPGDPRGDLGFGLLAIGQAGEVGGVDHAAHRAAACALRPARSARRRRNRTAGWRDAVRTSNPVRPACRCPVVSRHCRLKQAGFDKLRRYGRVRWTGYSPLARRLSRSARSPSACCSPRPPGAGDMRADRQSGSIGATNVLRTGSKGLAAATVLLDAGKGAVAVPDRCAACSPVSRLCAAVAAVAGHCFPVWLGFQGRQGRCDGRRGLLRAGMAGRCSSVPRSGLALVLQYADLLGRRR